jgi:D-glycero-beta-D-manno-heptose 1-phosphate adenylyltransferase
MGDVLIVGLNSDNSIRKIKGDERPIVKEDDRLIIISSLESVDYVFLFGETSADQVLKALKPDIHAKGTDYTELSVPERETVLSYGGKVAIAGDPKSHATRDIVKRIKETFISSK